MRVARALLLIAIVGTTSGVHAEELRYGDVVTTVIYPSVIECACWRLQVYRGGEDYRSAIEIVEGPYLEFVVGTVSPNGDLWTLNPTRITRYDRALHPTPVYVNSQVVLGSIAFDRAGTAYVTEYGNFDRARRILKFDAPGTLQKTYDNPFSNVRNIELGPDGCTLYLMPASWFATSIHRYDVCSATTLPDLGITAAPATRIPPSHPPSVQALPDGSLLVPRADVIVRLTADGRVDRFYDVPNHDAWRVVAADPDGVTFWAVTQDADADGAEALFRIRLSDGVVVQGPIDASGRVLYSMSVVGDRRTRVVRAHR